MLVLLLGIKANNDPKALASEPMPLDDDDDDRTEADVEAMDGDFTPPPVRRPTVTPPPTRTKRRPVPQDCSPGLQGFFKKGEDFMNNAERGIEDALLANLDDYAYTFG